MAKYKVLIEATMPDFSKTEKWVKLEATDKKDAEKKAISAGNALFNRIARKNSKGKPDIDIISVFSGFIDQSPKLWQIDIQNKKTKRAAKTFFCFAENGSEANIKAKKALKMLGEGYELANAPHHIATKGDGQAEQYLKSGIKVIDKSPLSFMDSTVRAFRDETFPPDSIVIGEFVREERPYKKNLKLRLNSYSSVDKIKRELKEQMSQSDYYDKGEPYYWKLNAIKIQRPDEKNYRKVY